jgi:3D (Asp-Asp-Asp) domain-containing protein
MPIPRKTERISDARLDRGMSRVVREGSDGVMEQMILIRRGESGILSEAVMKEWVSVSPEPKVIAVGTREPLRVLMTSRGSYTYRKSYSMIATAYEPSERSCGKYADGYTAIGVKAAPGIVAVDPKVIPLRTRLYVEGYGPALAADVGGAIRGNRIDLFFNTVEEALRYGRRRVKVYVLEDR